MSENISIYKDPFEIVFQIPKKILKIIEKVNYKFKKMYFGWVLETPESSFKKHMSSAPLYINVFSKFKKRCYLLDISKTISNMS